MTNKNNIKELKAICKLNLELKLSRDVYNQGTIDLMNRIQSSVEDHINWADIQHALIDQMGMENYLVSQTENPVNNPSVFN